MRAAWTPSASPTAFSKEPPDGEKMQHGAMTVWILRFLLRARGF
jgi:hypothetical protein